jgi:hypothetical protein
VVASIIVVGNRGAPFGPTATVVGGRSGESGPHSGTMREDIIMTTTDAYAPDDPNAFDGQADHETPNRSTWHRPELTTYGCVDGQTQGFYSAIPRSDGIYYVLS